jgi:transcription-repair coupling factor (superfamily II helicase)
VFDHAVNHIAAIRAAGRRAIVAGWTEGSLDRLTQILADHGLDGMERVASLAQAEELPRARWRSPCCRSNMVLRPTGLR